MPRLQQDTVLVQYRRAHHGMCTKCSRQLPPEESPTATWSTKDIHDREEGRSGGVNADQCRLASIAACTVFRAQLCAFSLTSWTNTETASLAYGPVCCRLTSTKDLHAVTSVASTRGGHGGECSGLTGLVREPCQAYLHQPCMLRPPSCRECVRQSLNTKRTQTLQARAPLSRHAPPS
jgi:hypothetical protein